MSFRADQVGAILLVGVIGVLIPIAADPSRRAALLIGGAQLIGSSVGPFFAGMLVDENSVTPVLWFGTACIVAGVAALLGAGTARQS